MGLKEILRKVPVLEHLVSSVGIDLYPEFKREGRIALREEDMKKLNLAKLFLNFNQNSGYVSGMPKSKPYTINEIADKLCSNGYANNPEEGMKKARELVDEGFINFYWAAKGPGGVRIKAYEQEGCGCGGTSSCNVDNSKKDTYYRFELDFLDDGL